MTIQWLLLSLYFVNIFDRSHSREFSLQCWRCEVAIQSSEQTDVFLDDCQAKFDFTQHTREDCDGKCWKSVDLIDGQQFRNTTRDQSLLENGTLSKLKSSRRCFSVAELMRASEMGMNTSNGCRKVKRDEKKTKEVCFCSDQDFCNNSSKLKKEFFMIFLTILILYLNKLYD